ncbi:MAG: OmpA family protein [Arenimonas sp.]|jgi:outer membrane protein OmpA-like peptidoglycan-associated protein
MKCSSLGLIALLIFPAATWAATPASQASVVDLKFTVLDLVFDDGDVGGQVTDLAVKETATEIRIELAADVLFEFDKAVILPKAEQTLKQAAALIGEKATDSTVRIEGHTDAKGDDNYNQRLSERRAEAVKNWFASQGGLNTVTFSTRGLGEQQPVAPNTRSDGSDDPEGRQKNRRVEIVVKKD